MCLSTFKVNKKVNRGFNPQVILPGKIYQFVNGLEVGEGREGDGTNN